MNFRKHVFSSSFTSFSNIHNKIFLPNSVKFEFSTCEQFGKIKINKFGKNLPKFGNEVQYCSSYNKNSLKFDLF